MRMKKQIVGKLKSCIFYTSFFSGTVEKICKRQKLICPACGQSLSNGKNIEVHHVPGLKDLRLFATPKYESENFSFSQNMSF